MKSLWIVANVDETSFKAVRPGEKTEIYLPALDRTFDGQVTEILPAAAGLGSQGSSQIRPPAEGTTKTTPQIPIRVALAYDPAEVTVLPGMSATVRIYIHS
jgi:multidrug resistance efflux pump